MLKQSDFTNFLITKSDGNFVDEQTMEKFLMNKIDLKSLLNGSQCI